MICEYCMQLKVFGAPEESMYVFYVFYFKYIWFLFTETFTCIRVYQFQHYWTRTYVVSPVSNYVQDSEDPEKAAILFDMEKQ